MRTGLITHPACLGHAPPGGHPESPDRLRAVLRGLEAEAFQMLVRLEAPGITEEGLRTAHGAALIDAIRNIYAPRAQKNGFVHIDGDTVMSPGSLEAACRAAGAVVAAVDEVHSGRLRNVFCAIRPPGHHAERDRAMGFCLFNNVAIGALHARKAHGYGRVAIVDFDVHHGNGTQNIFEADENTFYGSTHQWPFYPGTGSAGEHGSFGNIFNVPLHAGSGTREFRAAYEHGILPALRDFAPDFIFISAGFDAHYADPLAQLQLSEHDFAWVTSAICEIAGSCCGARVVSALEGGYDLDALARSAAAHVGALMEAR